MKKIALIPVYNEESTLRRVLDSLAPLVDQIVLVDDGSSDNSPALAVAWARDHAGAEVLKLAENSGMSAALREGFLHLASKLKKQELDADDLLLTLDADGQHDAGEISALCEYADRKSLDVALTLRDFSLYPYYKRLGNSLMTLWGSFLSGFRYSDVESGFRVMRMKVLPSLLDYYIGYRYSCAQEIAILTARLGFTVDNRFRIAIQHYRSQTGLRDVITNASLGAWVYLHWLLGLKIRGRPARSQVAAGGEQI
jgi:glycosyltransferase involved in cell wall biosynthesis